MAQDLTPEDLTPEELTPEELTPEELTAQLPHSDLGRAPAVDIPQPPSRWRTVSSWMLPRDPGPVKQLFSEPTPPPVGHDRVGICCSGGGLRSASFAFGGMQVLWNKGILASADYLAGVSGGSYAVTAATMLRMESEDAFAKPGAPGPFALGSPELDYLRNRTNYLAPGIKGRLNMGVRVVSGTALNVAVVFATVFVMGRVAGWLYGLAYPWLRDPEAAVVFGPVAWALVLVPAGLGLLAQLADMLFRPARDTSWRFLVRWSGTLLAGAFMAAVVLFALPAGLAWLRNLNLDGAPVSGQLGGQGASVLGALAVIAGSVLNVLATRGISDVTKSAKKIAALPRKLLKLVSDVLLWVVGPLAVLVTFLVGADATTDGWSSAELVSSAVTAALLGLLAWQGNPITWSLQPFYKRRLRSVFCLERVIDEQGNAWVERIPQTKEPKLSELKKPGVTWPELVICAAVNISDLGWTPPRTGVAGFTFSPTEVGGHLVGYVPTHEYEQRVMHQRWFQKPNRFWRGSSNAGVIRDVSPLSAVSISGAAISPSMGRQTRAAYRMMLTLLNLRLGVWLPNPRHVAGSAFNPRRRVKLDYLLREMAGANRMSDRFLYVSDGGHYENLGLVELLRLGCTEIWCLDACGDRPGELRTLGQAEALARAELGVEFDPIDVKAFGAVDESHPHLSRAGHAIINFRYHNGRPGRVIYVRKALHEGSQTDLLTYQVARPIFPYDGTGDQFYDFEQFEAYRRLGVQNTEEAVAAFRHVDDDQGVVTADASR